MAALVPEMVTGSRLDFAQQLWGTMYEAVLDILGTTGTILAFGDPNHGKADAATFTTVGSEQVVFTWSKAIGGWDTPLDLRKDSSYQGIIPILEFDAVDQEADTPDAAYWSRDDAGGANGFSVGAWVNVTDSAAFRIIFSKWDDTGSSELREWDFLITSSDLLGFNLYDESMNVVSKRESDSAITQGEWRFFVGTYDGAGGTAASDTQILYDNGVVLASTATNNANYAGMEAQAVKPALGRVFGSGGFFNGLMAGGPIAPFFTQVELTADQVLRLYEIGRRALAL